MLKASNERISTVGLYFINSSSVLLTEMLRKASSKLPGISSENTSLFNNKIALLGGYKVEYILAKFYKIC